VRATLYRIKTFWKRRDVACVLYTGGGRFELRLVRADALIRSEACHDSGDAYRKAQRWGHEPLSAAQGR
jgi:hypothetical protein